MKMKALHGQTFVQFLLLVLLSLVSCEDYVYIATAPGSIKFNTIEPLRSSNVADMFSAMLGFTLDRDVNWKSLAPVNPFQTAQAIFVLEISGVNDKLQLNLKGFKFPLENSGDLSEQYDVLAFRTYHRFGDEHNPILLKIETGNELYSQKSEQPSLLKSVPATTSQRLKLAVGDEELSQTIRDGTFNISVEADAKFLVEVETVKLLLETLVNNKDQLRDSSPDVFWLQMSSLQPVIDEHGADSFQAKEAYRLVEQLIGESAAVLDKVYQNEAVVAVLAYSNIHPRLTRKSRSLLESTTAAPITPARDRYNLAHVFEMNFNITFALVAFTSIVLILAALGVSVGIWFMDPGRDSIIYRGISQRMKKD